MSWIGSNWIWIILIGGMIAMHLLHGGHGGHAGTSGQFDQSHAPEGAHSAHRTQPPALGDKDDSAPAKHRGC